MIEERSEEMEKLIENEKGFLWAQAMRITGKPEDADDLYQDTLMRACKGFSRFERDSNFRAWAKKIMINTHLNKIKRGAEQTLPMDAFYLNREHVFLNQPFQVMKTDDPEKVFFHNYISKEIMELFYSMPDEYRIVFSLFHFDGYTYEEISKALSIPEGTVKSRIHRARRHMTEKIRGAQVC
jgi:RNA polymerase sigma-70 factor, ECF subfamily